MLELCFLLQLCAVYALPEYIARVTSSSSATVVAALPTPPPAFHNDLVKRAPLSSSVCGWVNGVLDDDYHCVPAGATCLWDIERKTVGCGNAESMPSVTSCYEYASRSNCDEKCKSNSQNFVCSASAPYCNTIAFPSNFSMILSCADTTAQPLTVAITYTNMKTAVNLPRSLVNGQVAFATQTPPVLKDGTKIDSGSIIAASIGAAVLLCGLPFGIKMFIRKRRWSKAQRPRRLQEREMRRQWAEPSNPYSRAAIPTPPPAAGQNFLFSQDWHGRSKSGGPPGTGTPPANYELQSNG